MKTKFKLCALIFALLCMAIIFMPNEVLATDVVEVDTYEEMRDELERGNSVKLMNDIKITGNSVVKSTRSLGVAITGTGDITVDGNGFTVSGTADKVRAIFEIYANEEALNVTFKNITITNAYANARAICTRTNNITLNLESATLNTETASSNPQGINVGGTAGPIGINITNSEINAGKKGYGIMTYNPIAMKVEKTKITGYAAIYLKGEDGSQGSEGSSVTISDSELNGIGHSKERFGVITLEDNNTTINITDSILCANIPGDSAYNIICWGALDNKYEDVEVEGEKTRVPVQNIEGNVVTISGQSEMNFTGEGPFEIADSGTKNTVVAKEGVKSNTEIPEEILPAGAVAKQENGKYVVYVPHDVVINKVEGGTVTVDKVSALAGETVTITTKEDLDYELKSLKVFTAADVEIEVVDGKFVMPNLGAIVVAEFTKIIPPMDYIISGNETENNNLGVVESEKTVETLDTSLKADTELNKKVEEERQKGNQVTIEITMEELDNKDVKEEEKQKILETVKENQTVHQYFDISVLVKTQEAELGKLTQLTEKMKFSMEISQDLIQEGRKFYILKLHGDEVEKIEAVLNGTKLEFETDQFSTFALAYEDAKTIEDGEEDNSGEAPGESIEQPKDEVKEETKEEVNVPNTGDNIVLYIALALIAVVGIVLTKKANTRKK